MALNQIVRKIKYGKPIIIVSGLPRSGTSMLMKMLETGGIEIVSDGIRTADIDNPKGYYELERVKRLNKGQDKSWLKECRGKAVKIISYFLESLPDNNNYKIIFIERNLSETIASQNKMLINRGEGLDPDKDEKMIEHFENHLIKTKNLIANSPKFEVLYLSYNDLINDPKGQTQKINRFLGGHLKEREMTMVVDSKLYRNREQGE